MYDGPPPDMTSSSWKPFFLVPAVVGPICYGLVRLIWYLADRATEPPPSPGAEIWFPSAVELALLLVPAVGFGLTVLGCTRVFAFYFDEPIATGRYYRGCLLSPFVAVSSFLGCIWLLPPGLIDFAGILAWMSGVYICLLFAIGSYLPGLRGNV